MPCGVRLVYQPPYTPEPQPAEHLWPFIGEPLADTHFETIDDLDAAVATLCCKLHRAPITIASNTHFH